MKDNIYREAYEVSALSGKEQSKYWLIRRYQEKASQRLLNEKARLRKKGKDLFEVSLRECAKMIANTSWMNCIEKEEGWKGAYIPIPINLKE